MPAEGRAAAIGRALGEKRLSYTPPHRPGIVPGKGVAPVQHHAFESDSRLGDRLAAARRTRFVGREGELDLFRSAIASAQPPFAVLYVYGPGGIGKTTLVQEWMRLGRDAGRPVVRLDARHLEPAPEVFLAELGRALGLDSRAAAPAAAWPARGVLVLDTYENIAPLDSWLREMFLPQLSAQTLIVIAGRQPPAAAWTTDIAWAPLTRVLALRNFRRDESETYLTACGVAPARHAEVIAATYGHPLALSLAADALLRDGGRAAFEVADAPDIVRTLLENLVDDLPDAQHRLALYACAFTTAVTEPVLAAALGVDDAHGIFDWLGRLSFIEHGSHGLFPHDLARDVLYADARLRNPGIRRQLNERLLTYLYGEFQRAHGIEQQRLWFDIIYLQRYNPAMRPYFVWSATCAAYAEAARPEDSAQILDIVEQHEGTASRAIAAHWLRRQPEAFLVIREHTGTLVGLVAHVRLEHATAEDARIDPAVAALQAFMQRRGPLRRGEEVSCVRLVMARDLYQARSPSFNVLAANTSLYWTTHRGLAWSFIVAADSDYMLPLFTSLHVWREPEADFEVGGRRYGVFAHDWRVEPVEAWFRSKVDRATDCEAAVPAPEIPPLLVLAHADFVDAVRHALREYTRPERLAASPLLRTRVCAGDSGPGVDTLRALLAEAANALTRNPKDRKLHLAVWHTFFEPARTQEEAAEFLGLPFNTYRYQLARAIERVSAWLWERELRGSRNSAAIARPPAGSGAEGG
jgi:hypothetical protein